MSVIAWDGETLAADKRACIGTQIRTTTKIFRHGEALIAYAGNSALGEELKTWWVNGADPLKFPTSQRSVDDWVSLLVIRRGHLITKYEASPYPVYFEDKQFAIGSGNHYALAAMYLGQTAVQAVKVAIALDTGCGGGVDTLEFNHD